MWWLSGTGRTLPGAGIEALAHGVEVVLEVANQPFEPPPPRLAVVGGGAASPHGVQDSREPPRADRVTATRKFRAERLTLVHRSAASR